MSSSWIAEELCVIAQDVFIHGITMDNNGIIYFTTGGWQTVYQHKLNDINSKPQILVNIENTDLRGIVWNANNNTLYICDNFNHSRILSYSIDTGNLSTLAGNGHGHKDGNIKDAQFRDPRGIAMDRNGDLYITGERDGTVRKINMSSGTVITVVGSEEREFLDPFGIAVSDDGTIYVADTGNHCIRKIKDGIVSTIAGTVEWQGNEDGPLSNAMFDAPVAVIVDNDDILLVGDDNGVRRVDLHQQIVSTVLSGRGPISGLCNTGPYEFIAGGKSFVMKISNSTWKWKRWIWIGHLKENPCDCFLATLPRDIIKEISFHIGKSIQPAKEEQEVTHPNKYRKL